MSVAKKVMFNVNKQDSPDNIRYRVLAVLLSSVPAGKSFSRGSENLDSKLCEVMRTEERPVIKRNFAFHPQYGTSKEISWLLSVGLNYGSVIGLKNSGMDFIYGVTETTHEVAQEIIQLRLLKKQDILYLKNLGERLTN